MCCLFKFLGGVSAMAATDIDRFIRDQKVKIAQHRKQLRSISPVHSRKKDPEESDPFQGENMLFYSLEYI